MALLKKILFWLIVIVALLLGIWTWVDNDQEVLFKVLGFQLPGIRLGIFAVLMFTLGAGVAVVATLPSDLRHRRAARRYRRRLLEAESKLAKAAINQQ